MIKEILKDIKQVINILLEFCMYGYLINIILVYCVNIIRSDEYKDSIMLGISFVTILWLSYKFIRKLINNEKCKNEESDEECLKL